MTSLIQSAQLLLREWCRRRREKLEEC